MNDSVNTDYFTAFNDKKITLTLGQKYFPKG